MPVAEIFKALGDPIRLEMVQRLSSGSSYALGAVSAELGITRQGARRHLEVLRQAELVTFEPKGRDVLVRLDPVSLDTAKAFIAKLEKQWDARLTALKDFVESR